MRLIRTVHPSASISFAPLAMLCPDITITDNSNGDTQVGTQALCFVDPDGEAHVYVLNDEGLKGLRAMLSGLEVARTIPNGKLS